jgi:hypothetical protein
MGDTRRDSSRAIDQEMQDKIPEYVVSLDVENYFHAEVLLGVVDRVGRDSLLATLSMRASFLVLGTKAETFPSLRRQIAVCGHDLEDARRAHYVPSKAIQANG